VTHDPAVAGYVDKVVAIDGGLTVGLSRGGRPDLSPAHSGH
jgi:hypothetical protein